MYAAMMILLHGVVCQSITSGPEPLHLMSDIVQRLVFENVYGINWRILSLVLSSTAGR